MKTSVLSFPKVRPFRRLETGGLLTTVALAVGGPYSLIAAAAGRAAWVQVLAAIGGTLIGALAIGWAISEFREIFGRPGEIRLGEDEIVIDSPRWFTEPVEAPLNHIRFVTLDWARGDRRFAIEATPSQGKDRDKWLWRKEKVVKLPYLLLNPLDETPNLAIAFGPPIVVRGHKFPRVFLAHFGAFINRNVRVILALVENPDEAQQFFEERGLLRNPNQGDVAAMEPTVAERIQQRRINFVAWTLLTLLIGGWVAGAIWAVNG